MRGQGTDNRGRGTKDALSSEVQCANMKSHHYLLGTFSLYNLQIPVCVVVINALRESGMNDDDTY
eukprot:7998869-Ditylum_brightwellii.AAC.1